jgi:hypothetical protein
VLINPADVAAVADGVLVNAVWAVGQSVDFFVEFVCEQINGQLEATDRSL